MLFSLKATNVISNKIVIYFFKFNLRLHFAQRNLIYVILINIKICSLTYFMWKYLRPVCTDFFTVLLENDFDDLFLFEIKYYFSFIISLKVSVLKSNCIVQNLQRT